MPTPSLFVAVCWRPGISESFGESGRHHFHVILLAPVPGRVGDIAAQAAKFTEEPVGKIKRYRTMFGRTPEQAELAVALLQHLDNIKGVLVHAGGRMVVNQDAVIATLGCFIAAHAGGGVENYCHKAIEVRDPKAEHGHMFDSGFYAPPRYVLPCSKLLQSGFVPDVDAGGVEGQILAEAARNGCDWCPNFQPGRMEKIMMKIAVLAAAISVCCPVMAQDSSLSQADGPGGAKATCQELDRFPDRNRSTGGLMNTDDIVFNVRIADWTPEIVGFLKSSADSCAADLVDKLSQKWQAENRKPYQPTINSINNRAEKIKRSIDTTLSSVEKEKAVRAKEQAEKDAQQRIAACEATSANALYSAQERVIAGVENIAGWKENQAYERRVAQTSGVRNLREERNNGEWIVRLNDELTSDFAEYKRLGGKAATPQKVTHQLSAQCADLR